MTSPGEATLARWTHTIIRVRFVVLAAWLLVVLLGLLATIRLPGLLSNSLEVPGTSSQQADAILTRHFGENPEGTFTVVFQIPNASKGAIRKLSARIEAVAHTIPGASTIAVRSEGNVVFGGIVTRFDLQQAQGYTEDIRRRLRAQPGPKPNITGPPAIQEDLNPILAEDLRKGESIALPVALLMIAVVLGIRGVLIVPFVFAACTISASLGIRSAT